MALRRNLVANLFGNAWTALLQLALLPIYLRYLGPEAFGLVAVFTTIQSLASIFDVVLGTTLNREVSRMTSGVEDPRKSRDLVRSLEIAYWAAGIGFAIVLAAFAPLVATHWLHLEKLSRPLVIRALWLMAAVLCVQWPSGFYGGGLLGIQRQVEFNVINGISAAVRGIGAVCALRFIGATVEVFFIWQLAIGLIQTTVLALAFLRSLPSGPRARFRYSELTRVARFMSGMTGISVSTLLLTQADNIIVSKLLPLNEFGYYVVAGTLGLGLSRLISPVSLAVFPRFNQFVARNDRVALTSLFHSASQAIALLMLPAAAVTAVFSREVLLLWTRDPISAQYAGVVLGFLVVGTAFNGLVTTPYLLQIAFGQTRLPVQINAGALVFLVPLITISTLRFGAPGAAAGWLTLNAFYLLISPRLAMRDTLPMELRKWYWEDVLFPVSAAGLTAGVLKVMLPTYTPGAGILRLTVTLVTAALVTVVVVATSTPLGRSLASKTFQTVVARRQVQ